MDTSKTQLKDRTLYYDGDSVVSPGLVVELIDKGLSNVCVTEETDEISQYNKLVPDTKKITTKTKNKPLRYDWNIPEPYNSWSDQDVIDYIIDKCCEKSALDDSISSEESDLRSMRVSDELHLYINLQLLPILRAIIY